MALGCRIGGQRAGVHDIQFWDLGDYPITLSQESLYRMVALMSEPWVVLQLN